MSVNSQRARQTCRNWDEAFPIGTRVVYRGQAYKTWSHAGAGARGVPCVFLDGGPEEPVPLHAIEVPGWTFGGR